MNHIFSLCLSALSLLPYLQAHICLDAVHGIHKPYAIVTLIDGDMYASYFPAANVLRYSLSLTLDKHVLRKTDFVVITSRSEHMAGLDSEWKRCHVPDLYHPFLNKQWAFLMDDYERVLYMDADTFAGGDMSPMLSDKAQESLSVTGDWFETEEQLRNHLVAFNTGVYSFKPGKQFHKLFFQMEEQLDAANRTQSQSLSTPQDQSKLNSLFAQERKTWFNFSFNAWLNGLNALDGSIAKRWNQTLWEIHEPIRAYHLIGHCPPPRPPQGSTGRRSVVYERWWRLHDEISNTTRGKSALHE
jgi:Glycosyl transferase family 8